MRKHTMPRQSIAGGASCVPDGAYRDRTGDPLLESPDFNCVRAGDGLDPQHTHRALGRQ